MNKSNVVIGLEVHVQITSTKTKLFCSCPTDYRGKKPNTNVCPVCLGLPGALPVVNKEAVKYGLAVALALNAEIPDKIIFSRKHYFYPDLPKNYQITQYHGYGAPLGTNGYLKIRVNGKEKTIGIQRIHLEEDPGKLVYEEGGVARSRYVFIDYNRSGIPLLEIVTLPQLSSPLEAELFLEKLRIILEYLEVTDPRMEGWMRVDANISIAGHERVEVKNIGSIKDVRKALEYEVKRQEAIIKGGGSVKRETRHWDSLRGVTLPSREKEYEEDYRYFPDPDLPPILVTKDLIESAKSMIPELPDEKYERFIRTYRLAEHTVSILVSSKKLADIFEEALRIYYNPKRIAGILVTDYLSCLEKHQLAIGDDRLTPANLAKLVRMIDEGVISVAAAKDIFWDIVLKGVDPEEKAREKGYLGRIRGEALKKVVIEVMNENPKAVKDAKSNTKALNYLVGLVLKKTRGKADPREAYMLIAEILKEVGKNEA